MAKNVGGTERIARGLLGAALVLVALRGRRGRGIRLSALIAGVELIYTAATQYCPANAAAGRDTCPSDQDRDLSEMPA
jgi:uncharacterized membrane protein